VVNGAGPSIKMVGADQSKLAAIIQAARNVEGPFGKPDADFNAADVAVQGVLELGKGLHDHTLTVTSVEPVASL
jgi:hypothetical protein